MMVSCRPSFRHWKRRREEGGGGNLELEEGCKNGIIVALEMSVGGVVLVLLWKPIWGIGLAVC